ncbi:MAG: response regulator [Christensenellales bacterium]|jgi:two-component system response regulator (stage 0 sporulation protein A)
MEQIRVLIADNSRDFARLFSRCLSINPDIQIVGIAQNGSETIQMLQLTDPDVLLLDLVMPFMDGFEVLRRLEPIDTKPLVYVISALGSEEMTRQAIALGARYYFVKPLNTDMVISKIREAKLSAKYSN